MSAEHSLKKIMEKEYKKVRFSDHPRHYDMSFTPVPTTFTPVPTNPSFIVSSSGVSLTDLSMLMGAVCISPRSSPRSISHSSSHSSSYSRASERPDGYVPADLAARGIVAVKATSEPRREPAIYARCATIGCTENHLSHFCKVCRCSDVSHFSENCPLNKFKFG